jgi:hypothetical protein
MRRTALLTGSILVLAATTPARAATFYFHKSPTPVAVPGGTTTFVLDENAPVASTPVAESVSVPKKTTSSLPTFIAPAFTAPATLGLDFDVLVHLSANLSIDSCATVVATIERVDAGGGRSFLANGSVGVSIPQGGGGGTTGFAPLTISFARECGSPTQDAVIGTGESIAVTVSISNSCKANRTVSLAYDATSAPTAGTFDPLPPVDPLFLRACFAKCQLGTSKASVKFIGAKMKCVLKCESGARRGSNSIVDCIPPYSGLTAICVSVAESKATTAIAHSCTGPGRCPTCYGGDCNAFAPVLVNLFELMLDGYVPGVFCDDTTDTAKVKCIDGNAKALAKFHAAKNKCYDKCFSSEIKGAIAPGSCGPPATDPIAALCIVKAEDKAIASIDRACFVSPAVAPACYSGATAADFVSSMEGSVDAFVPAVYCASPSGAFVE